MRIQVEGLRKTFRARGDRVVAVDGVSLTVDDGEFLVILGPSGSGKTTLLRCVAGLEQPDEGEIAIEGRVVFSSRRNVSVPPERRGVSMVFQNYALWPHMNVFDNVAYPLRSRRTASSEVPQRVREALEMVGCGHLERRHPGELSGGQQQRVALARAIVTRTGTVLFDEPLSSVDARVREELRRELRSLQRRLGFSSLYVTHDQTEATVLGDRVAVMNAGDVIQIGPPREVYDKPRSIFVASFIGAANSVRGTVEREIGGLRLVRTDLGPVLGVSEVPDATVGSELILVFRPEYCRISESRPRPVDGHNQWAGAVERSLFLGECTEYLVRVGTRQVVVKAMGRRTFEEGTPVWIAIDPEDVRCLKAG